MRRKPHHSNFFQSFRNAGKGIAAAFSTERNLRVHFASAVAVIAAGFFFGLSNSEWIALILCVGLVSGIELLNTSIEYLADALHPDHHEMVGAAKDIGAGAVLIASVAAATVGAIIFVPKLWALLPNNPTG